MQMTVMMTPTAQTQRAHTTVLVSMAILEMESVVSVRKFLFIHSNIVGLGLYEPNVAHSCIDVNECEPDGISDFYKHLAHNCHNDSNCTNTKGSFYCTCLVGYSGDGVSCSGKWNIKLEPKEAIAMYKVWLRFFSLLFARYTISMFISRYRRMWYKHGQLPC